MIANLNGMAEGEWTGDIDTTKPSAARMYDYYLGGSHNFAADRAAAEQVIAAVPNAREIARANRAFLHRAVRYLLDRGVTQFLDIGSGIPTVGNVHDIAREHTADARVVYVDIDPVAVAHSIALLRGIPQATAIRADLRYPDAILQHHGVYSTLDLSRPVGLLLVSMLHFLPDEHAYPAVAQLRSALAAHSYLAVSHVAVEGTQPATAEEVTTIYRRTNAPTAIVRSKEQILRFFGDYELSPPGLVWVNQWQHTDPGDTRPESIAILAGVGQRTEM